MNYKESKIRNNFYYAKTQVRKANSKLEKNTGKITKD